MFDYIKKLLRIIPSKVHYKIYLFILINFFTVLLEMLGIVLIIPLISILFSADLFNNNEFLSSILVALGNPSQNLILIYLSIFIIFVFFIKNLILSFFVWWQADFSHNIQLFISQAMFKLYLSKSYIFHVSTNTAKLIRNTGIEANNVRTSALALMTLITESFLVIGIVGVLIYYNPFVNTLILVLFSISAILFYLLTKNRISRWGAIRLSKSASKP